MKTTSPFATVEEALEDIKAGKMVIVCDDEDRENEGDLTIAAEFATPEVINFMAREGRGLICLAMEGTRCSPCPSRRARASPPAFRRRTAPGRSRSRSTRRPRPPTSCSPAMSSP
jgi:hypothetical protein